MTKQGNQLKIASLVAHSSYGSEQESPKVEERTNTNQFLRPPFELWFVLVARVDGASQDFIVTLVVAVVTVVVVVIVDADGGFCHFVFHDVLLVGLCLQCDDSLLSRKKSS